MIVTYSWLKEFVDFDYSPQDLADRLTMIGFEVEGMTSIGAGLDSVIVARLEKVERHPDADRLTLCQVDTGKEVVQVVCGASNHKSGDLVALAQPGSVLPGDFKIKKSKIRGQVSMGMLCSEKELGLSHESEGILILAPECVLATPIFEALQLKDTVFEIGLTPNRPDGLSVVGIAREVAAICGNPLRLPQLVVEESGANIDTQASVEILDTQACPRYGARLIRNVKIGPSPDWMVQRLESVGMRSINNVVDVTNYVMLELGHPLHAFDFRFLSGGKIVVKRASSGEVFTTLDDAEHRLVDEDLMICDAQRPVAMAGVMGGQNSEIQTDTQTLLLEAAYFDPTSIRRTSKRHGLHTESSHRFERGADVNIVPLVLDRAAALIAELAQGEVAGGVIDCYPRPLPPVELTLSGAKTQKLLGVPIELTEISRLLQGIGLQVESDTLDPADKIRVQVPSFRPDLEREIDLIEEIARLYGYDNIPQTLPQVSLDSTAPKAELKLEKKVRNILSSSGFCEVINYSFVGRNALEKLQLAAADPRFEAVPIRNPLTEDQAIMRTTLVPSMLETLSRNLAYRSTDLQMFELRPVFFPATGETGSRQELRLVAAISGQNAPLSWALKRKAVDFYDLKAVLEKLLTLLEVQDFHFCTEQQEGWLHPGKSAQLKAGGKILGVIGELHPQVQKAFDLDQPVYLFDIHLDALFAAAVKQQTVVAPSRFPAVERDSALLIDARVEAAQVLQVARKSMGKFGQDIVIFDLYTGQGIPAEKKSLALRVRYASANKTLTEDEVSKAHTKLVKSLCHQLNAEIR